MDPSEYARLRRLIVISWTISLIFGMIVLYLGSRELATVKNAVDIQQASLNSSSIKVDKLIERVNDINSQEFKSQLKGDKGEVGDKGDTGLNGKNGVNGMNAVSNNTIIEKQQIEQVPFKGEKGDKGDQGEKGEDARQIELCKLPTPLISANITINLGWKYTGTDICFEIEGDE